MLGAVRDRLGVVGPLPHWLWPTLIGALGVWSIWIGGLGDRMVGGRVANSLILGVATVPLFWRRRHPIAVLGLVVFACALAELVLYGLPNQPPVVLFFALLLAIYAAAAGTEGRQAKLGLAVLAIGMVVFALPFRAQGSGNVIPAELFLVGAWALGRTMHRGSRTEAALRERTARLEVEREERARDAALAERARIARELHDVVAHSVSVMVLQASVERRLLDPRESQTRDTLAGIERVGRQALVDLRRLLGVMRRDDTSPALTPQPTLQSLPKLVDEFRSTGLEVNLATSGEATTLSPGLELSAFRIIQESLTNAVKHSDARHAEVQLRYGTAALQIDVTSETSSAQGDRLPGGGHGLIGMRERAMLHGGALRAGPVEDGRYAVHATLNYDA